MSNNAEDQHNRALDNIHYRTWAVLHAILCRLRHIKVAYFKYVSIWAKPKYTSCMNCEISSAGVAFEYPSHFCTSNCLESWCESLNPLVNP